MDQDCASGYLGVMSVPLPPARTSPAAPELPEQRAQRVKRIAEARDQREALQVRFPQAKLALRRRETIGLTFIGKITGKPLCPQLPGISDSRTPGGRGRAIMVAACQGPA